MKKENHSSSDSPQAWRYLLALPLIFMLGISLSQIYQSSDTDHSPLTLVDEETIRAEEEMIRAEEEMQRAEEEMIRAEEEMIQAENAQFCQSKSSLKELILSEITREIEREKNIHEAHESELEHQLKNAILDRIINVVGRWDEREDTQAVEQDINQLIQLTLNHLENEGEVSEEEFEALEENLEKDVKRFVLNELKQTFN